jgi:FK506-binding nuclear protein
MPLRIFAKCSPIYLSGNYMSIPDSEDEPESDDDDDEEYDMSPNEDEMLIDVEDSEEDELDELNGRIEEITYRTPYVSTC